MEQKDWIFRGMTFSEWSFWKLTGKYPQGYSACSFCGASNSLGIDGKDLHKTDCEAEEWLKRISLKEMTLEEFNEYKDGGAIS